MTTLLSILIISIAFLGESIFGFAGGLISVPLLTLIIGLKDAVSTVMFFQFMLGILVLFNWKEIDWRVVKKALLIILFGTVSGVVLLDYLPEFYLKILLLVLIISYLIKELLIKTQSVYKLNQIVSIVSGFSGGLLQGTIGTGGPALLIYLNEYKLKKSAFRATIILLFFICNCIRLPISYSTGLINYNVLQIVSYSILPFLIAIYFGQKIESRVSEKIYKIVVYTVISISGLLISLNLISQTNN